MIGFVSKTRCISCGSTEAENEICTRRTTRRLGTNEENGIGGEHTMTFGLSECSTATSTVSNLAALRPIESEMPSAPAGKADALFGKVYAQLKTMARRELGRSSDHTLDTTALVHELYVKICTGRDIEFAEAAQFFSYSARAMRHILLDRAYRRVRVKVGGDMTHVDLSDPHVDQAAMNPHLALQLDAALTALEAADARAARVVELHYFAGLGFDQVAELVGVSRRTVDRDWRYARAFLFAQVE
jgi:RNA polymerase sigma factor (TIGR02999 family)